MTAEVDLTPHQSDEDDVAGTSSRSVPIELFLDRAC